MQNLLKRLDFSSWSEYVDYRRSSRFHAGSVLASLDHCMDAVLTRGVAW
jgi:hypothetical protein